MKLHLQKTLVKFLTKNLFHAVTEDDILKIVKNQVTGEINVFCKGEEVDAESLVQLREEAQKFKSSVLWKVLRNDAEFQALKGAWEAGMRPEDLYFQKAVLFALKVFKEKLDELEKL